ncbi:MULTISPECIES: hypothetical protein [unclassified Comamonas]|uniref:Uncharacterized protein n=1 Tax=Comamonas squillarum TaxID=2977320 RepID=A0ABY5ZTJ0_9BURK|nr:MULTISPECIES: hypothetical protein [unclassified Comamonas]PWB19141.1 hypothetical protein DCO45_07990 [Comamonas sp. JNW]UXC17303.1 hypothetical protein N4T19_16535 [Comamonas sp. PR12]
MAYAKEFFDLQIYFARKIAVLANLKLETALLDYTNFYVRLVGGRDFDPHHPRWMAYIAGLKDHPDLGAWTYHVYTQRPHLDRPDSVIATFGCFSYALGEPGQIRLHFHNDDHSLQGPLSDERMGLRLSELAALVAHVRAEQPSARQIAGVSWLYHLPTYKRLFPPPYTAHAMVASNRFRNMPLWGQFLNRHGGVRKSAAAAFLQRVDSQASADNPAQCFPLLPLATSAPVDVFHDFYQSQLATRF